MKIYISFLLFHDLMNKLEVKHYEKSSFTSETL